MIRYIFRRLGYSVLIVLGVVALTFLLFDLAAGDPAAAVLGKNAKPEEIEALRRELGADLPLFYGKRCRTEACALQNDTIVRRFGDFPVEAAVKLADGTETVLLLDAGENERKLPVPPETVSEISFYRLQSDPCNSRFVRALGEIVSFQVQFPFVKVLDFGRTISTKEPISAILKRSIGPSLALMVPIFCGELVLSLVFALIAVAFRDRWIDRMLVLLAVSGMSISYLVVILFAQWYLGYYLELFPLWGAENWRNFGLPVIVGILCGIGANLRFYRTVLVDELGKEYLRTAVAKGASPGRVYGRHLLRNAALQIITRSSATIPFLFTGSLLLESFFGIPGLGFAGVDALYNSDIQLLKAIVVLSALIFVVVNLLADLAYAWADPRIRLE
ncbi:MAG: ABC transporter permease [Victivallaceae bacterium]|nr:ABC transporter permease [Victivallaceae bacterium]